MAAAPGPLDTALDRLRFETQYLVDVLHLARGQGQSQCVVSTASLRATVDGLLAVADMLQQISGNLVSVPTVPPTAGAT